MKENSNTEISLYQMIGTLRKLRTCGFPTIVNPNLKTHEDEAEKNLWYFKCALMLKNYSLDEFSDDEYSSIKKYFKESSLGAFNPSFVVKKEGLMNTALEMARELKDHVENMSNEVFVSQKSVD